MGSYSFKSSGKTSEQTKIEKLISSPTPIGIKTPLEINFGDQENDAIFLMHYKLSDVVHDNLKNLILTNWGERVGFYRFGGNLKPLLTEYTNQDDFDNAAIVRIRSAVSDWMPYVSLDNFLSTVNNSKTNYGIATISIVITYSVPDLNVDTRALEIILKTM